VIDLTGGIIANIADHASTLSAVCAECPGEHAEITVQQIAAPSGEMLFIVHGTAQ
jgi:hypothetical protein